MSDCFGRERDGRVEWSIPMGNYADQLYRLLEIMERKAAEYGVDTGYGDWFTAEVREYEHRAEVAKYMTDKAAVPRHQLTLWFDIPEGK